MPVVDPAAEIPVEQIHGPVLLDCGTDDQTWTSRAYAQAIQNRLGAAHHRFLTRCSATAERVISSES